MPKFFSTVTVKLSEDELKSAYQEYLSHPMYDVMNPMSFNAFKKVPNLNVYVDMKCLNCHHELRTHFGDYALDMEDFTTPFPLDWCPNCGLQHLIPKDIYNKLTLNVLK